MILPVWVKIAAAGALFLTGALCGWTVQDWRRDSSALSDLKSSVSDVQEQTDRLKAAGDALEKSRDAERAASTVRESTIREIYHDNPVPADCALVPAAGSVLDDAIRTANARAAGEPSGAVPPGGSAP